MKYILVVNTGSTSTKMAVFCDLQQVFKAGVSHGTAELAPFSDILEQKQFRKDLIVRLLAEHHFELKRFDAVVGRGGLLKPVQSGAYTVNEAMLRDLSLGVSGRHASNLGGLIAYELAADYGIPAYIANPVVVDELDEVARITGLPEIRRKSIFHALNQKAVAKRFAADTGRLYEELDLIVAHLGGGISVGAHKKGRVVDVNNALDGDGPLAPERAGSLPNAQLIDLCFSGRYTREEMKKLLSSGGGLVAYFGTNSARAVAERAAVGDVRAQLVYAAMIYQTGKEIGALAAVFGGRVDAILLTGGIAYDRELIDRISAMVGYIAPIHVYPGEDELTALAENAYAVLSGCEEAKQYQ